MAILKLGDVMNNVKSLEWMHAQKGEVLNQLSAYADKIKESGKTKEAKVIHDALKKEYVKREVLDKAKASIAKQVASKKPLKKAEPTVTEKPASKTVKKATGDHLAIGTILKMKDGEGKKTLKYEVKAHIEVNGKENVVCVALDGTDYIVGYKVNKKNALITPRGWEEPYTVA